VGNGRRINRIFRRMPCPPFLYSTLIYIPRCSLRTPCFSASHFLTAYRLCVLIFTVSPMFGWAVLWVRRKALLQYISCALRACVTERDDEDGHCASRIGKRREAPHRSVLLLGKWVSWKGASSLMYMRSYYVHSEETHFYCCWTRHVPWPIRSYCQDHEKFVYKSTNKPSNAQLTSCTSFA